MSSPDLTNKEDDLERPLIDNEEHPGLSERSHLARLPPCFTSETECECTITEALDNIGVGKFQYLLVLVIGWANASDSIETLCTSFLLPSAQCELNMSSTQKGALNSAVFVGMMFGGYIWGSMADIYGRRTCLVTSLAFNGLAALGSSFIQSYNGFLTLRLLSGFGVGGSIPVLFTYLYEFQPTNFRGWMGSFISTCWAAGNILAAGLAWIIIPRTDLDIVVSGFKYTSWRMFVAACTVPSLTGALLILFFPESPRYLLNVGKETEALNVIRKVYSWNTKKPGSNLKITRLLKSTDEKCNTPRLRSHSSSSLRHKMALAVMTTLRLTASLLRRPHVNKFLLIVATSVCLSFSYYGLWMWLPELINRVELSGGSVCASNSINTTHHSNTINCSHPVQEQTFVNTFITTSASIPTSVITMFILDRLGASIVLGVCCLGSSVSVFFIWLIQNKTESIVLTSLFGAIMAPCFCAINLVTTVAFPTNIRSTAFGVTSALTRISAIMGNLLFGLMVDVDCAVPILTVACLLLIASLTTCCLPATRGHAIQGH